MEIRNRKRKQRAALQCLALALGIGSLAGAGAALGAPQTVNDCRSIADEHARLLCYDQLPGAVPAPAPIGAAKPQPQAPVSGLAASPAPASAPAAPPAAPVPPTQPSVQAAPAPAPTQAAAPPQNNPSTDYGLPAEKGGAKPPKSITVTVAQAGLSANRKLRIVTSDGMIWEQTIGVVPKAPKPGTEVVIKNTAMGGHWCQINKWTAVRCERVDRPKESKTASAPPTPPVSQAPQNTPPSSTAPAQNNASAAPAPPATNQSPTAQDLRASYGLPSGEDKKAPKEMTVEIASAGLSANQKLRLVTTDGTIWEQTIGPVPAAPKPGTTITIRKAAMGGHWCQVDKWHAVRCERVQ